MTDWKREKLWLRQETGQVYTRLKDKNTTVKQLKQRPGENLKKKQWHIQHLPWVTIPGMGRWEILIPALICNVNQSNEQYITLIQGCISIKSQHPLR